MKRRIGGVRWLALVALVAGVVAVPSALADSPQGEAESLGSDLWFVQMNGKPTAAGGSESAAKSEQAAFRAEAKKAGVSFTERYAFHGLWNGLSIQTSASSDTLASVKGVKAVYPVLTAEIPPTETIDPELATALTMTGADIAQDTLGFTGEGIRVAVMDTGIDLDHPDLGGDGVAGAPYPNDRVVAQRDFVGDAFNASLSSPGYSPTPVPDPIADDCNGHGTHVSGIVGANGAVTGVAPDVTFGAYRVFGCDGSTTADIMIAAMEMAWQDDMDVLNMSIGSAFNTWPQYPTADAASALQNRGVVVVASIGNSGSSGVYSAGAPGVGDEVIGVASYDNTFVNINSATVTPGTPPAITVGYQNMSGAPPPPAAPFSGSLPLAKPSGAITGCVAGDYAGFPAGAMSIVQRGGCLFAVKAQQAQAAGAAAVVIFNSVAGGSGYFAGTVGASSGVTIYAVTTSLADGNAVVAAMAGAPQTWNWSTGTVSIPNSTGGTISAFSSFGLNAELTVKPDIGAPGGLIRSTYPLESGTYATISGTSMSSPHVAGAAALLLQSNPNIPTDRVRDVLQNSADPKVRFDQTYLDNVHRQGAGMLDIDDSITATTWLKPGKISLGEGNGGTETIQLTNKSGSAVTYDLSHQPAAGTTNTFAPVAYSTDYASASFSSPSVVVPGNGSASVNVTITPNAAMPNKGVYGGYIKFTPQGGGQEYRVPYAGFKGDYQSIQVLGPGGLGFPLLGKLTACGSPAILRGSECFGGGSYSVPAGLEEYTLAAGLGETPFILAHFDHQARKFVADVYRASDDKWMGVGIMDEYLPRNSAAEGVLATAEGFFPFAWSGEVAKGNNVQPAADGIYYFKVTVTKPLGNPTNTETWTSPDFEIDRPA